MKKAELFRRLASIADDIDLGVWVQGQGYFDLVDVSVNREEVDLIAEREDAPLSESQEALW